MLYEPLMYYYSILILSPIIQTIFPSLSFQHIKSFIKSIFKYLNELNICSKSSKLLCLPFLAFFSLSLVLFLINRMENTYNGFSIFKSNDQITKYLRWGSRRLIFDRESFPYQFCIPMKKKYTSSLNGMKVNLATRKVL